MIDYKISSFCNFGECVEVGRLPDGGMSVRATAERSTTLEFTRDEWAAFVRGVKAGEFDVA